MSSENFAGILKTEISKIYYEDYGINPYQHVHNDHSIHVCQVSYDTGYDGLMMHDQDICYEYYAKGKADALSTVS